MPPFALPLPGNSYAPLPRPAFLPSQPRRRKRKRGSVSPDEKLSPEPEIDHAHAYTNPLSLTPAQVTQYRLAGLDLNDELPDQGANGVKNFPHRALPILSHTRHGKARKESEKGKEVVREEDDDTEATNRVDDEELEDRSRGPGLHLRHLSVLTAVLHKCLLAGDIRRASRAWAILIRDQFWGKPVDIKTSGYWAIGAELLMRSSEARREAYDDEGREDGEAGEGREGKEERWGSKEGWQRAKAYYEQLIIQYPYRRQFHRNTNAMDFWPAMLGCEIYGIQWEQKEGLRNIEKGDLGLDESEDESGPSEESDDRRSDEDDMDHAARRGLARRARRENEKKWQAKEEVRLKTLGASEAVAERMDTLMSNHPYIDSRVFLKLRAMLALYIGDLSVPAGPAQDEDEEAGEGRRLRSGGKSNSQRLLIRQRRAEYERGKEKRGEQRALARELFEKIMRKGGWVGDINHINLDEGEEEAESRDSGF